jgi:hypothetical protein
VRRQFHAGLARIPRGKPQGFGRELWLIDN